MLILWDCTVSDTFMGNYQHRGAISLQTGVTSHSIKVRTKMSVTHFRRGDWDVYVGRHSAGARRAGIPASACIWGNPFAMRDERDDQERAEVVAMYERWLLDPKQDAMVQMARRKLEGKTLACWCKPKQCHGDVLAWVSNARSMDEINRRRMELGIREVNYGDDDQRDVHSQQSLS